MSGLQAHPLDVYSDFNWVFLVEILVIGILALFFLFYFNRLFATVVSLAIRSYTWHKYRAYIDITALQISLLGGRLFFKSIRYHAHNITLYVYEGHVTWRYWLRLVQDAEVFLEEVVRENEKARSPTPSDGEKEGNKGGENEKSRARDRSIGREEKASAKPAKELPCRISVKVAGVESFIYNRSPLYDGIIEATLNKAQKSSKSDSSDDRPVDTPTSDSQDHNGDKVTEASTTASPEGIDRRTTAASQKASAKPKIPSILRMFPIRIECRQAAAAVGNENTTNILVAKVGNSEGTVDAGHAGQLDIFKLLFKFDLEKVNVVMKPNRDFKELQADAARRIRAEEDDKTTPDSAAAYSFARPPKFLRKLQDLFRRRRGSTSGSVRNISVQPGVDPPKKPSSSPLEKQTHWHGLTRYLDDKEVNEHEQWQHVEYAKASTLADIEKVTMCFYWDIPGPVPEQMPSADAASENEYDDDMNATKPPAYGMELGVHGGIVTYGPWADRQRINLQHVFFPAPYVDAVPAKRLKSGELRVCSVFKICVVVEEDVVLRIPTREESKDDRWKGRADKGSSPDNRHNEIGKGTHKDRRKQKYSRRRKRNMNHAAVDARPYGWLDITVKKDTIVNYNMDMFSRREGYRNSLDIDVTSLEMSSSVNHGLLWRSGSLTLDADLSQPKSWNARRKWPFNIVINEMELFILRDHLFLIIDLVNDWASGPPPDFYTFVPYNYQLNMTFRNFCMYLNANDANIINDPADFERNDFLTLEGQLHALLGIPVELYRPKWSAVTFDVLAESLRMRMLSPLKSTLNTFLQDKKVADLPKLTLNGSFNSNTETMAGLTDLLRMDLVGTGLTMQAYGFFVRQLVNVKENYFGDYMHFKTLEEFQGASDDLAEANIKTASFPKPKSINELDVVLCIVAEDITVIFPTGLYSAKESIRAEVPRMDLDLRVTSYYLDMGLNLSPISLLSGEVISGDGDSFMDSASSTQFYVAHLDLNGHRLFGLPPDEIGYACEWDIDIGKITGELSTSFIHNLAMAGRTFAFTIQDAENALPVSSPIVAQEITFVQVRTDYVRLSAQVGNDALIFAADPINVETNDWADETCSQRVSVIAPRVTLACIDARRASRPRLGDLRDSSVRTYAFVQTGAALNIVSRKLQFPTATEEQQGHIRSSDQRTNRVPFLIRPNINAQMPEDAQDNFEPPAMIYPILPGPLKDSNRARGASSIKSNGSLNGGRKLGSKSSMVSLASSLRSRGAKIDSSPPTAERRSAANEAATTPLPTSGLPRSRAPDHAERVGIPHPSATMAFSSSYSEPYFPLTMVEPDETLVPAYPSSSDGDDHAKSDTSSLSDVLSDSDIDEESEHLAVFIRVTPGIRAYVEPRIVTTVSKLINEVVPENPSEVMDAFQMSVMGSIQSRHAERYGKRSILEIQGSLPGAHVRVAMLDGNDRVLDQLDLTMKASETSVRVRNQPSDMGDGQFIAVHSTLAGLEVSLSLLQSATTRTPAIRARIDDVLFWTALGNSQSVHVSFRNTNLTASGQQMQDVCSFLQRLLPLVSDLKEDLEDTLAIDSIRLQLLINALMQTGEDFFGDPAFLTRMVYLLRAVPHHLRNHDSWKVVTRFRHILQSLPKVTTADLEAQMKVAKRQDPKVLSVRELEDWAQRRNWDIPYVNQTLAFNMIFGQTETAKISSVQAKPLAVTFESEAFRVAIENETDAVEIVLADPMIGVERTPPTTPEGLMIMEENKRTKTVIQMHTSKVSLALDWSLFNTAENIVLLKDDFEKVFSTMSAKESRTATQAFEDGLLRHDFHVAFSTDTGNFSLKSINLWHVVRSDGLKLSLIGTTQAGKEFGQAMSAILNCDTAVTELHGPSQCIWRTLLTSPSLYADHLQPAGGVHNAPTVTLAIAYEDVRITISEQLPGVLHIVDLVVVEEVAKVQHLIDQVKPKKPPSPVQVAKRLSAVSLDSDASLPTKVHVALLAGEISLELSLLQSLSYQLQGTAGSIRVAPSLSQDRNFSIDFDVGRQNHAFINTSGSLRHSQGILEVPPINGHIGLEFSETETSVSVVTTIEKVEVDAGAIQGVIGVVNRPEVRDVISAIKTGIEDVQAHVLEIIPQDKEVPTQKREGRPQITYDFRFALLGVRVAANTPLSHSHSVGQVEFGFGPLHATASNRMSHVVNNTRVPEIRAQIQGIGGQLLVMDQGKSRLCGSALLSVKAHFNANTKNGVIGKELKVQSDGFEVNVYPETASTINDVVNALQDTMKELDLSKEMDYLRRIRDDRRRTVLQKISGKASSSSETEPAFSPEDLLSISTNIELRDIQICWLVDGFFAPENSRRVKDLIFSIESVEFTMHGGHEARLTILNMQLQLAKKDESKKGRALNSALLPEVEFCVGFWSQGEKWSLAFKASGKALDVRLEPRFITPINAVQRSIEHAIDKSKKGSATWQSTPTTSGAARAQIVDVKRLGSLAIEADFAGAKVFMQGSGTQDLNHPFVAAVSSLYKVQHGRYGQFAASGSQMQTTLTAPGIALRVEYESNKQQPTVNGELRIDASSNTLSPNVVPLLLEVSESIKEVMQNQAEDASKTEKQDQDLDVSMTQKFFEEDSIIIANPSAIFGKTKVNFGLRVCKQEFGLSCQPIAKVDASASLEDLYFTVNTIDSEEQGRFFAMSMVMTKLAAQVKHVYSREPTFSYEMDSIVLSAMNNKHLSGTPGVSAILSFHPTRIFINGKQFQDLLLFREIWLPPEIRNAAASRTESTSPLSTRPEEYFVQRYQQAAAAATFPWNANVSIAQLEVDIDFGQSIGKTSLKISNLWASQQKSSDWEQNLCVGLDGMDMTSSGRVSGFIGLEKVGVRTSIKWAQNTSAIEVRKTPLIQASAGFQRLRAKAAFEYQPFAIGDIEGFDFLMYNVRQEGERAQDRLVAVLDCDKAYVFVTPTSPAQAVGLMQAFDRLVQEKQAAFSQSLRDIEKYVRRESTIVPTRFGPEVTNTPFKPREEKATPISLNTDVVVTIGAVSFGVYPSTFFDGQILKLEANTIQARFAGGLEGGRITSALGMTLGQLQVALSSVRKVGAVPKALEVSVDEVITSALNAKGGIILRVPKVIASMQTYQSPDSNHVDYIFKSLFAGKIDVGWNLSRINFIKGMWNTHSRSLAARLGKSLPESAVKITAGHQNEGDSDKAGPRQEKITAEFNLPQSRYEYHALEPPIIETPQLRDMGEATPPLEWIGLHRERLPNVTHQIIIVSLLEVCKEVEDAYVKILGSS